MELRDQAPGGVALDRHAFSLGMASPPAGRFLEERRPHVIEPALEVDEMGDALPGPGLHGSGGYPRRRGQRVWPETLGQDPAPGQLAEDRGDFGRRGAARREQAADAPTWGVRGFDRQRPHRGPAAQHREHQEPSVDGLVQPAGVLERSGGAGGVLPRGRLGLQGERVGAQHHFPGVSRGRTDGRRGGIELLPGHEAPAKMHHGRFPPSAARNDQTPCINMNNMFRPVCLGTFIGHHFGKIRRLKVFNSPGREFAQISASKKPRRPRRPSRRRIGSCGAPQGAG
jgi:hypothetical protein